MRCIAEGSAPSALAELRKGCDDDPELQNAESAGNQLASPSTLAQQKVGELC